MRKVIAWIISIVIVLGAAGAVWWLFATNRLVYSAVPIQEEVSTIVCGSDIVDTFNDVMFFTQREGASEAGIDEDGVAELLATITAKSGYENDATCQTIRMMDAVRTGDAAVARSSYDAVVRLHAEHKFADSNLRGNQPLFVYEGLVSSLESPVEAETE